MPLPVLAEGPPSPPGARVLPRGGAAERLEVSTGFIDRMVRAGLLPLPITAASVDVLAGRSQLQVVEGEVSVIRADSRRENDSGLIPGDRRRWIGFHVDHSDEELEQTSLGWWHSRPERVLRNEVLVVALAGFPVAVYRVDRLHAPVVGVGERTARHRYTGTLLARVTSRMEVAYREPMDDRLRQLAGRTMNSRVVVSSGGPIGYLGPTQAR